MILPEIDHSVKQKGEEMRREKKNEEKGEVVSKRR